MLPCSQHLDFGYPSTAIWTLNIGILYMTKTGSVGYLTSPEYIMALQPHTPTLNSFARICFGRTSSDRLAIMHCWHFDGWV